MMLNLNSFLEVLPLAIVGWLGIFVVVGIVIALLYTLNGISTVAAKKKEDNEDEQH